MALKDNSCRVYDTVIIKGTAIEAPRRLKQPQSEFLHGHESSESNETIILRIRTQSCEYHAGI